MLIGMNSPQRAGSGDPLTWDLADRMRKSLRASEISVHDMADYLGVSRNAVSTWINGHITPSRQTLLLWAARTGVTYEWLRGEVDPQHDGRRHRARALTVV